MECTYRCYKCNKVLGVGYFDVFLGTEPDFRPLENYGGVFKGQKYCISCLSQPEHQGGEVGIKYIQCGDAARIGYKGVTFTCPVGNVGKNNTDETISISFTANKKASLNKAAYKKHKIRAATKLSKEKRGLQYTFAIDGETYKDGTYELKVSVEYRTESDPEWGGDTGIRYHREPLETLRCSISSNDEVIHADLYHTCEKEFIKPYKVFELKII